MYIINRLREPGVIKSIRMDEKVVKINLAGNEVLVFRRVENEDVDLQEVQVRCGSLPSKL